MGSKTEFMQFRCSPKLRAFLERVATAQEMTVSEVIRAACEDYTGYRQSFTVPVLGTIEDGKIIWNSPEVSHEA